MLSSTDDIVAPVAVPPSDAQPVLVIGSVRSGTSVVVNALKEGAGLPGYYETNVAPLMQLLLDVVDDYLGKFSPEYLAAKDHHMIASLDRRGLETWIRNYFAAIYQRKIGQGRWVGKSPDSHLRAPMIRACPHIAAMFPKARFVFCLRRGIENVLSRQRKFPDVPFEFHCQSWAHTVEEWFKVKPLLGDRAFEVRQRDIALAPAVVADDLARFLDLDADQRRGVLDVLAGPRREQMQLAQEHRDIGLDETPWDSNYRDTFMHFCGPAMRAAGFSVEGTTAEGAPVRLFFPSMRGAIRTENVNPEWGFTEIDRKTFQLHPNEPSHPAAEVRWQGVTLRGESSFSAELSLGHEKSPPVIFAFRVEGTFDGKVHARGGGKVSKCLAWQHYKIPIEPLFGTYDVVLSTEMAEGAKTSDFAWAQFRDPHLR